MVSASDTDRTGSFKYLSAAVEHSLYRNGKVATRRNQDGSDAGWDGVELEARQMPVRDARSLVGADQCTLLRNGFEVQASPLATPGLTQPDLADLDFLNHDQVVKSYYPQCAETVRQATGARFVGAFDHNVRSAAGKQSKRRIEGGQEVQGPAHVVHGDYTLASAPQRLRDLTKPPGANDTLATLLPAGQSLLEGSEIERLLIGGRYAIINVWRNIAPEPVVTHPLALCDAASVRPEDLVVFEIHYHDRIGENYFAKHADGHKWYFYPDLTRDEALLIKQWDSFGELARTNGAHADAAAPDAPCTFSFHSAFEDPTTPDDAPERWSIEVRCVALYD
ncbi:MAG: CmcJ/NvfI family oxidoreductase [Alphaproteobacteria bacterium]|nr:CmcJ/NvfI family oxidoreductase [Alphaproteobacteria bacterium]